MKFYYIEELNIANESLPHILGRIDGICKINNLEYGIEFKGEMD